MVKHCRRAQLCGQQLPAKLKKGKVKTRELTAHIIDWDSLTEQQRLEVSNWGAEDISEDEDMSAPAAGGSGAAAAAGGGGGIAGGVGPGMAPPTLDKLTNLVHNIGITLGTLATQVWDLTQQCHDQRVGVKDPISQPKPWNGKGGSAKARHFLTAFHNYASSQGPPLNNMDVTTRVWIQNESVWIQMVLNLMEEEAHTWVLPHLETIQGGRMPFTDNWGTFTAAFECRFSPLDTAETACEALKKI